MVLPVVIAAGLTAAPAIAGLFVKQKKSQAERELEANLAQARDLANLLLNPNDPRYKTMLDTERENIRTGYLAPLRDLVEANRRQALLGRQQIFDPERRDESMFTGFNKAAQQASQEANQSVLDRIKQSISGLQGTNVGYQSLATMQNDRNAQKRQNILAALSAGSKLGSSLGGLGQLPSQS
jgi:hypothetical protein